MFRRLRRRHSAPYASVILPAHARPTTLPYALRSVQNQTISEIEILIVLDGASGGCKQAAFAAAKEDPRVRVLDLPKTEPNGKPNVHSAVLSAKGPRVFYIDDDDLWLTNHVETLGGMLDRADFADTRVASVGRAGKLHLSPFPQSNPEIRRCLAEGIHKTAFDTHIAHRRDAYGKFGRWAPEPPRHAGPVWSFLIDFAAASNCTWHSSEEITALSLHGAARRDMSDGERQSEIEFWSAVIADTTQWSERRTSADSLFHLFRLLSDAGPVVPAFDEAAQRYGFFRDVREDPNARHLFDVMRARPVKRQLAELLVLKLTENVQYGYACRPVAQSFAAALGEEKARALFERLIEDGRGDKAGLLCGYGAVLGETDPRRAIAALDAAMDLCSDPCGQIAAIQKQITAMLKSELLS